MGHWESLETVVSSCFVLALSQLRERMSSCRFWFGDLFLLVTVTHFVCVSPFW
jgi:hypothetical protein